MGCNERNAKCAGTEGICQGLGGGAAFDRGRWRAAPLRTEHRVTPQFLLSSNKFFWVKYSHSQWKIVLACCVNHVWFFLPSPSPIFQTLVIHLFVSFSSNIYSRVLNSLTFRPINNYWNKSFIFLVSTTSYISPFITQSLYSLPIQLVVLVFVIGLPVGEMRTRSLLPNHQPTGRDKS